MVLRELVQLAVSVQVRTAVAHVHHTQLYTQMERHRHRRPHAVQFRVPCSFFRYTGVGLTERGLELRENFLRFGAVRPKEPLERIERELLDRGNCEGTGSFARLM